MANLSKEQVKNLIALSRIDCTEEEQASLLKDLSSIFTYFEELNEINTDSVPPCNHVLQEVNVVREDVIGPTMPREEFLANAPSHTGGMIRVPPVLKQS